MLNVSTITFNDASRDALPLPNGGTVGSTDGGELARRLIKAGVPGIDNTAGKHINAAAYAAFIEDIRKRAADDAVNKWLAGSGA
jgi:hypothetical protein